MMNLRNLGTPRKKNIMQTIAGLLKKPEIFTSKRTLHELQIYNPGENALIDIALWYVFKTVENGQDVRDAISILERTTSGEINTQDELRAAIAPESARRAENKKRWIDQQEAETLKDMVEEAGVISLYDLMTRFHTRELEKIKMQMKEGGIKLVEMPALARTLENKRKKGMLHELELLLGAKDIWKVRLVAMSPEYYQRVLEELKKI